MRRVLVQISFAALASTGTPAQEALLPSTSWGMAPTFAMWHFSTAVQQGAGDVRDLQQVALPFRTAATFANVWTVDLSGAVSSSSMSVESGSTKRTLRLTGLSDVKVRINRRFSDVLQITAGLNLPVGTTGLNADQTAVLQFVSAPSLRMPVGALGLGPGVTLGVAGAHEGNEWTTALGAAVEARSKYTPVEMALSGATTSTRITPGTAVHVTAGADHAVGPHRLSLLIVGDLYATDHVALVAGGTSSESHYQLGPQLGVLGRLDLAVSGWRESGATLWLRHRSAFSDASGSAVSGSDGNYAEAAWTGLRGGATGRALIVGVDARYHGGLKFTESMVGAAVSAAGVTGGVELPMVNSTFRIALRAQYGQFTTGGAHANGMGLSLVGAIAARRDAR